MHVRQKSYSLFVDHVATVQKVPASKAVLSNLLKF